MLPGGSSSIAAAQQTLRLGLHRLSCCTPMRPCESVAQTCAYGSGISPVVCHGENLHAVGVLVEYEPHKVGKDTKRCPSDLGVNGSERLG